MRLDPADPTHPAFPALIEDRRWNGWVRPRFRRDVTEALLAWLEQARDPARDWHDSGHFEGDTLILVETEERYRTVITPDPHGRYSVEGWCWELTVPRRICDTDRYEAALLAAPARFVPRPDEVLVTTQGSDGANPAFPALMSFPDRRGWRVSGARSPRRSWPGSTPLVAALRPPTRRTTPWSGADPVPRRVRLPPAAHRTGLARPLPDQRRDVALDHRTPHQTRRGLPLTPGHHPSPNSPRSTMMTTTQPNTMIAPMGRPALLVTSSAELATTVTALTQPGQPLLVINLDQLSDAPWQRCPLILIDTDTAPETTALVGASLGLRKPVLLSTRPDTTANLWRAAVALRVEHVACLPDAADWVRDRLRTASHDNTLMITVFDVCGDPHGTVLATALANASCQLHAYRLGLVLAEQRPWHTPTATLAEKLTAAAAHVGWTGPLPIHTWHTDPAPAPVSAAPLLDLGPGL